MLLFPNYLPFGNGEALQLNKFESPLPKDTLFQVWLKLAGWFCDKFTDAQTDGRTDRQTTVDRWSETLTWNFSSGELKKICFKELKIKRKLSHQEKNQIFLHGDLWNTKKQRSCLVVINFKHKPERERCWKMLKGHKPILCSLLLFRSEWVHTRCTFRLGWLG